MIGYILTVTAAAILVAILQSLAGQGTMGRLVKLIAGVFMALTVISPLLKLELPDMEKWFYAYTADAEAAAAAGEGMANEAAQVIIKKQLEAYILDKAALYRAALSVEVALDEAGVPVGVTIAGDVSPYVKARLTRWMETDLGLGEEMQQWTS